MVFMEIINLDETLDKCSDTLGSSTTSSPMTNSNATPQRSRKRKKKMSRSVRKLKRLLLTKQKKVDHVESTNQSSDSDATLDPETNLSCLQIRNDDDNNPTRNTTNKRKRRNKRASVVVIDSDDDCVVTNNNQFKKNKNISSSDVVCLSDSSIIVLSDNEDVGVAAGMVETIKGDTGWKDNRVCSDFTRQIVPDSSKNCTSTRAYNSSRFNGNTTFHELKKRLGDITSRNEENLSDRSKAIETTSSEVEKQLTHNAKVTKQDSRHSISYLPSESTTLIRQGPRPIVIDGSNVAFGHGKERFSAKGIEICVDYFLRRKHTEIRAFVPQFRRRHVATVGVHIMEKLEKEGHLVYTPSRHVDGKRITSYDDRYIVEYAAKTGGVIITRDNYQDLLAENKAAWSDTINFRLLQYTFVGDMIMFPQDPLGRGGPTLDKFLMF